MKSNLTVLLLLVSTLIFSCSKESDPGFTVGSGLNSTKIINDNFNGESYIVIGNSQKNYIVSYYKVLEDGSSLNFTAIQDELPKIMEDDEGNIWDIWGTAISGPRQGEQLRRTSSRIGYFFSFASFFPGLDIYGQGPKDVVLDIPEFDEIEFIEHGAFCSGGVPQDGIASLEFPIYIDLADIDDHIDINGAGYFNSDELMIGVNVNGDKRAVPIPVINYHEIVNDDIGEEPVSVIFCPLTGTSSAWSRNVNDVITSFGVSGFLYNNNIVPYDRTSDSRWSQMRDICVQGSFIGTPSVNFNCLETSWETWKEIAPDSKIVDKDNTGQGRDYSVSPYGDYATDNDQIVFPDNLDYWDDRLPAKERVLGLRVGDEMKVYRFSNF